MILKIILIVVLFFLLFLLFYPVRFLLDFSYAEGKGGGNVKLCPFFTVRRFSFTVFDTEEKSEVKKKRKKQKKKEIKNKGKDDDKQTPVNEKILIIINLLGKLKRGIKRLRVNLNFAYGFPDPAVTGEITGALYASLPPLFGNMKYCPWKIGLYPQWCPPSPVVGLKGEIIINVFDILIAFAGMIPDIMKILPKKKNNKKTEVSYESASH